MHYDIIQGLFDVQWYNDIYFQGSIYVHLFKQGIIPVSVDIP